MINKLLQRCFDGEASKVEESLVSLCLKKSYNNNKQSLVKLSKLICECSDDKIKPKEDLFTHVAARIEQERYREKFAPVETQVKKPYMPWAFVGATCCLLLVAVTLKREPVIVRNTPVSIATDSPKALNIDWVRSAGRVNIIKSQNSPILWVTKKKIPTPQASEIISIEKAFPSGVFPQ